MRRHASCLARGQALLFLACATHPLCAVAQTGCCPQTTIGWMLFEDSNPGPPDFWYQESIQVEAISVCSHGVFFMFPALQGGQRRYVAFVVVNPTREFLRARVGSWMDERSFEVKLERSERCYAELVRWLSAVAGQDLSAGGRLDFSNVAPRECPVIVPRQDLSLHWRGASYRIRGYLDVYMTLII